MLADAQVTAGQSGAGRPGRTIRRYQLPSRGAEART